MTLEPSEAWSRHARSYERLTAPFTGYLAQSLFLTAAGRLPAAPRILDVACGTGELSKAAVLHCVAERARSGRTGLVVAADFAAEMLALTERNVRGIGGDDLVWCERQDGQALGFDGSSFDAVFSAFGIFLFPDRRAGWREAARVLRPGGLLATAVWRGPDQNPLARLPVVGALPERLRASVSPPSWLEIASATGLEQELRACGFRDVEISVAEAVLTAPSPRAMVEIVSENPLTEPLLAQCTDDERSEAEDSLLSVFTVLAGGAERAVRVSASCHFALAIRS